MSLILLVYVYVGYPLVAALRARLWPKPRLRAPIEPTVSIIVIAHNEAERIGARIENLLALDYPRHKLEIVIGSDGSTDGTVEQALRYAGLGISVRAFHQHRGKPAIVNALVPIVRGEIVMYKDQFAKLNISVVATTDANFRRWNSRRRPRHRFLLALREIHPVDGRARGLDDWRDRRHLRHSPHAVRADPRGHAARRCADSAADRSTRLSGGVRAGGARARQRLANGAAGVRPQDADDRRHVSVDCARGMAAQSLPQPALVRNGVAQGAARRIADAPRVISRGEHRAGRFRILRCDAGASGGFLRRRARWIDPTRRACPP